MYPLPVIKFSLLIFFLIYASLCLAPRLLGAKKTKKVIWYSWAIKETADIWVVNLRKLSI